MTDPVPPRLDIITTILEHLDAVRHDGRGGWMARCPAHPDRTPSLHINIGDDQPIVLHCLAGCPTTAILDALGLTAAQISTPRPPARRIAATYDYRANDGELVFQVLRYDPKDFRARRPDGRGGWTWNLRGVPRVPYRLPELAAAVEAGEVAYVVEGEKDADRLAREGVAATTCPGGAGKWRPEYNEHFAGADVVIIADRDQPGRAHAAQVAAALDGVARMVIVAEPLAGKDVSDHLAAGHSIDDLQAIDPTTDPADPDPDPEPPPTSSWAPRDLAPLLDGTHTPIATLWLTRSDGPAIIYPGRIHSFHGEAESLKTWAAYCATAEAIQAGRTVIWIDLEDSDETAIARLQALGLTADQILAGFAYLRPDEPLTDPTTADQLVAELDPALVIIDSFNELLALQGLDPYNSVEITKAHQLIRRFTRNGAAAIIIDHVTKDQNTRGRWAIGSERKLSGLDGAAYTYETRAPFGHGRHGIARITCTKDRPGRVRQHAHNGRIVGELHLHSDPTDGHITWTVDPLPDTPAAGFRPTTLMDHVATLLAAHPQGLSGRQVRQLVPGRTENVLAALEHLVIEGYVQRSDGPRHTILHKLVRPFLGESDDERDDEDTA